MKTLTKLFIVLSFAFCIKTTAQITLLNTYPLNAGYPDNFQSVYLKHSGFKFVLLHSDSLTFYNLNLSLYEDVVIPTSSSAGNFLVQCISEGLFDTDTLHIDYMVTPSSCCPLQVKIYKDNGTTVFSEDSADISGETPGMQGPAFYPILVTDSGTFMVITKYLNSTETANQLYRLPGSLPCLPGCLEGNFATPMPIISNSVNGTMKAYPNPAVSYTNIYYTLPSGTNEGELVLYDLAGREIKKYTVTSQVDHLRLTTSDIAAGTYFYQLMVNGSGIATKKIVVVK
ncbi:MAG TPA: T9SS type A sorting domain-containing protein [Bacteroidia bacterium]|jgi:hypothetical protein|nr:T9SS type A sorting domain-containing protein [Bacteroidia bacterium]